METGGMKGYREEIPKEEFHRILCDAFGVGGVDVACRDAHPVRAAEHVASLRIGLRGEFGHAVFAVFANPPHP